MVQSLYLRLLVLGENDSIHGRSHVESYDVDYLVSEVRIIAEVECAGEMRFEVGALPYLGYEVGRYSGFFAYETQRPVGGFCRKAMHGLVQNFFDFFSAQAAELARARGIV